jgi:hypothetical protein
MKSKREILSNNRFNDEYLQLHNLVEYSMNVMRNEILDLLYNPLDDYYGMMSKEKQKLI